MFATKLFVVVLVINVIVVYLFWIRPLLLKTPQLHEFWDDETAFFTAVRLRFAGLKQKVTVAVAAIAAATVEMYDWTAPLISQSGVDVTTILPKIPPTAWPAITLGLLLLVNWFRKLAEKRAAADDSKGG